MGDVLAAKPHGVVIEARSKTILTGIEEVTSYDSGSVTAVCSEGELTVEGKDLTINSFDRLSGRLEICGRMCSLCYVDARRQKDGTLLSRLLK